MTKPDYVKFLYDKGCFKKGEVLRTEWTIRTRTKSQWRFVWPDGTGQIYYEESHKELFREATYTEYLLYNDFSDEQKPDDLSHLIKLLKTYNIV